MSNFTELDRADIQELEPALKLPFERGLLFDSRSHVINPYALCQRYFECFLRNQGEYIPQRAVSIEQDDDRSSSGSITAATCRSVACVIAAGAFSKSIEGIPAAR